MNWLPLQTDEQLSALLEQSHQRPQVIFKHSTRCTISTTAKTRLEKAATVPDIDFHFLDLLAYRALSNKIAELLHVYHESPQVLLIRNGECVYDESHLSIYMDDIVAQVA
ncbi:MAG: bacillithiol system redox-active protein YtxJ [Bacteroidetes bacterium]|nr:bacillithiol system redox-active protein YtxJ [Bacteroidota bacterium]